MINPALAQTLGVYCMKCVDYDVSWQRFLIWGHAKWLQQQQEPQKRKDKTTRTRTKTTTAKSASAGSSRRDPYPKRHKGSAAMASLEGDLSELTNLEDSDVEMSTVVG